MLFLEVFSTAYIPGRPPIVYVIFPVTQPYHVDRNAAPAAAAGHRPASREHATRLVPKANMPLAG
jgi:hypothetical protein